MLSKEAALSTMTARQVNREASGLAKAQAIKGYQGGFEPD
jgi:hypothetical protein